jgi:hypothetical protein
MFVAVKEPEILVFPLIDTCDIPNGIIKRTRIRVKNNFFIFPFTV